MATSESDTVLSGERAELVRRAACEASTLIDILIRETRGAESAAVVRGIGLRLLDLQSVVMSAAGDGVTSTAELRRQMFGPHAELEEGRSHG